MAHRRIGPFHALGIPAAAPPGGYAHAWSVDLDGSTEYLREATTTTKIGINPDFTVLLWVKPVSTGANLVLMDIEGNANNWNTIAIRTITTASGLRMEVGNQNAAAYKRYDLAGGLDLGSWGCYAMTWTSDTLTCYKNGSDITSSMTKTSDGNLTNRNDNVYKVSLGSNVATSEKHAGIFHALAIWDEVLTASELTALYNSGAPFDYRNNQGNYTSSANLVRYFWVGKDGPDSGSSSTWGIDLIDGARDLMTNAANVEAADVVTDVP